MKNVALHNLGCKVNSYEMEVMQQILQEKGYNIVPFDEVADIYIVNTCTVTNIADRKSRQMLHRARQKNPEAVVVAVGCYVQTGWEAVEKDACIDLAIGNHRKKDLVEILETYLARRKEAAVSGDGVPGAETKPSKTLDDTTIPAMDHIDEYEEMTLKQTAEHVRAFIKIQDGCNQFCSYCAIPLARGRVRSRGQEEILGEIAGMVKSGYREVVLTGIHISSYGIDFDGGYYDGSSRLIELVEAVCAIDGLERVRLGSLEPRIITPQTAQRLAKQHKVCPHFHLSLQSGCDETLRRMNRRYTTGDFVESVGLLREHFRQERGADPAITTDVIVGFPGETEEEFAETRRFLRDIAFYEMHIFRYSRRAGTRAATMPGQVPGAVSAARSNALLELEKEMSRDFRGRYIGREACVLWEERKEIAGAPYWVGHTADYVKIAVPAADTAEDHSNHFARVSVKDFLTEDVMLAGMGVRDGNH